jgi:hypothetical protein
VNTERKLLQIHILSEQHSIPKNSHDYQLVSSWYNKGYNGLDREEYLIISKLLARTQGIPFFLWVC